MIILYQFVIDIEIKIYLFEQGGECKLLEKVAEDDTYGVFRITGDHPSYCTQYQNCKVIEAPFAVGRSIGGGGWIFQKDRLFYQSFDITTGSIKKLDLNQEYGANPNILRIFYCQIKNVKHWMDIPLVCLSYSQSL